MPRGGACSRRTVPDAARLDHLHRHHSAGRPREAIALSLGLERRHVPDLSQTHLLPSWDFHAKRIDAPAHNELSGTQTGLWQTASRTLRRSDGS